MNFSIEESQENDLIIKAETGNISQTVQAVRINDQGSPLLGLAKSIYYCIKIVSSLCCGFYVIKLTIIVFRK